MTKSRELVNPAWTISYSPERYRGAPPTGPVSFTQDAYLALQEAIQDVSPGFFRENQCSHNKYEFKEYAGTGSCYYGSATYSSGGPYYGWKPAGLVRHWIGISDTNPSASLGRWPPLLGLPSLTWPSDRSSLEARAIQSMLPQVRPRLSILNSIYELKDFKSLLSSAAGLRRTIGGFRALIALLNPTMIRKYGTSSIAWYGKRSLRQLLRAGADGYLQQQFNLRPLLGDAAAIKVAALSFGKEVTRLLRQEGKRLRTHYGFSLASSFPNRTDEVTMGLSCVDSSWGYNKQRRVVEYEDPSLHVTMVYSYYIPEWQRQHAALLGILDSLGIRFDPAIIWNAIPWTFVVDWVVKVSNYLSSYSVSNIRPVTRIHACLSSLHVKRITTPSCIQNSGGIAPCDGWKTVGTIEEEVYYRQPISCAGMTQGIELSGVSLRELSLSAALGLSRLRTS